MLYVKKAIGRPLKEKMPLRLLTECAECDKVRRCQRVGEVWLCTEHLPKDMQR
jgi:hypothetical protein